MKTAIQSAWQEIKKTHLFFSAFFISGTICISSLEILLSLFPITSFLEDDYHTKLIYAALHSEEVNSFVPIFSGLAFAANYIEDIRSRFVRYVLARSSFSAYIISHVVVCFFCGALVVLSGVLNIWGFTALLFGPLEHRADTASNIRQEFFQESIILCMIGGFWAVVGMTMSTFMESKYIAYASPFVIYYLLVILCERYLPDMFIIYPKVWTKPEVWPYGWGGVILFFVELTLLFMFIFAFRTERRLRQI